ncbi:hypothetical protein K466DRAFT_19704 [Polyporus arcularius HHB13444]|uniref:Uncharacterized protein n=1 Tax=Polyporus arcularius HHB13444 TaxID=1314778 RepID=A0A5C3PII2_9APHY|nr:hypothetical protein K466DRAFT_19704 [Polyporus arcularius HHB13444]
MYAFGLTSFANRKRCAVRLVPKRGLSSIGTGVMRTRHRPLFLDTLCLNICFDCVCVMLFAFVYGALLLGRTASSAAIIALRCRNSTDRTKFRRSCIWKSVTRLSHQWYCATLTRI